MNPLLKDIFEEAASIVKAASEKTVTLGTAESCTGGLIGGALTAISGSSKCYAGGVVSYSNNLKMNLLGVPKEMLKTHGAVSEPVAKTMASGAREKLGVDIAISVTGIAGPGGGSEAKPVGTVWIGVATANGVSAREFQYGDIGRNRVRDQTVLDALKTLSCALDK